MATSWIIFDADNTLWDIESLYDNARAEFCTFLFEVIESANQNAHGYLSIEFIERAQRHRDLQLYATLGYSSGRFARSFEDTAAFLLPGSDAEIIKRARQFAQDVFETVPIMSVGLEALLARLQHTFRLAIITAGEHSVQRRRLDQFRLSDRFDAIEIVDRKMVSVFEKFCGTHDVDKLNSWVVGDSIRSDILPAREAGLKTIHLKSANWAAEHATIPEDTIVIDQLADVWTVISSHRNRNAEGKS